jgi:hypothetical protein
MGQNQTKPVNEIEDSPRQRLRRRLRLRRGAAAAKEVEHDNGVKVSKEIEDLPGGADNDDDDEFLSALIQIANMEVEEKNNAVAAARRAEREEKEAVAAAEAAEAVAVAAVAEAVAAEAAAEAAAAEAVAAARMAARAMDEAERAVREAERDYMAYDVDTIPDKIRWQIYNLSNMPGASDLEKEVGKYALAGLSDPRPPPHAWIDRDALKMLAKHYGLCIYIYNKTDNSWDEIDTRNCRSKKYIFLETTTENHYDYLQLKRVANINEMMEKMWHHIAERFIDIDRNIDIRARQQKAIEIRNYFKAVVCPPDGNCGYWAFDRAPRYRF